MTSSLNTHSFPYGRSSGQGTIEFILAAVPVLLLGLGSIEAIHWYFVRQAVSLALVQAARAGVTQHAHPVVLDQAFADALLPLHAGPSPAHSRERLQRAVRQRERETSQPAWRIRVLSPSAATFRDFASIDPELPRHGSHAVIDNDYLAERHEERIAQGWPAGRGPLSGQTTLEANTLILHLTWLHPPMLPGVRNLIRQLAPNDQRYGSIAMARSGYIPIHREVAMVMQSHAVSWDMPDHGRVVRMVENTAGDPQKPGADAQLPSDTLGADQSSRAPVPYRCTGLWCLNTVMSGAQGKGPPAVQGDGGSVPTLPPAAEGPGADSGGHGDASAPPDNRHPPLAEEPVDCPGCCD